DRRATRASWSAETRPRPSRASPWVVRAVGVLPEGEPPGHGVRRSWCGRQRLRRPTAHPV
ncbi:hypothetical protein, partial [Micromonospora sp. NPDC005367]|uniref:hypothetical protein n=1 Tax=Micromonospora sp. NPDC005367 TaxID=3155590 RepID=UPI0033A92026